MITRFYIDNFKSLVDFDLELAKFNCLIGLNGAGKSTVLQALDFTSAMISGDVIDWLEKRRWHPNDLRSNLKKSPLIRVVVEIEINSISYQWTASFNIDELACSEEIIKSKSDDKVIFSNRKRHYTFDSAPSTPITFEYTGSVLSQIKPDLMLVDVLIFKNYLTSLRSLDLLSPQTLRKPARADAAYQRDKSRKPYSPFGSYMSYERPSNENSLRFDIGMEGEQLSIFIHQLNPEQRKILVNQLQNYYPQIVDIRTRISASKWVSFSVIEKLLVLSKESKQVETESNHINDGMLRLIAILAQQFSSLKTLLFDEVENGINSEITENLVSALISSPKQIIVTTHSPMFLNYLDDAVAKESVTLLYKTLDGITHATRFFKIPSVAKKLEALPPGAAMLDMYLQDVAREVEISQGRPFILGQNELSQHELENWMGARVKFNRANGTLVIEKTGRTAIALKPKGEELLNTLPESIKQKIMSNQFVKVNAQVLQKEIIKLMVSE